jgi:hypothetical protein
MSNDCIYAATLHAYTRSTKQYLLFFEWHTRSASYREAAISHFQHFTNNFKTVIYINPLTPELNPSAQRCLTKFFTGDFSS